MRIARVFEQPEDGERRALVDRLWPRGLSKTDERIGTWLPEVAPSHALRRWFGHDPERFEEFGARYRAELETLENDTQLQQLRQIAQNDSVVIVTATRDLMLSHVPALVEFLDQTAPDVGSAEHQVDALERWRLFGGTWQVRSRMGQRVEIDLLRCDGGERVDSLSSDDQAVLDWLDGHAD